MTSAEKLLAKKTYSANDVEKLININTKKLIEENEKLKNEIKELKKENQDANKSRRYYQEQYIIYLKKEEEKNEISKKNTSETASHNARGAGRKQKLNDETIKQIKHERKTYGSKLSDLAKKFDISIGLVSKIINN